MKRWYGLMVVLALTGVGIYALGRRYSQYRDGAGLQPTPVVTGTVEEPVFRDERQKLGLSLPAGFGISYLTQGLPGARDLELSPQGTLLVSLPGEGRVVALPDKDGDGRADKPVNVIKGLNRPHGLAFSEGRLFIAETNQVAVYEFDEESLEARNKKKIIDLPIGGNHWSRSLLTNNKKLYVSVGSSCNVCYETDWRRAKILIAGTDGSDFKVFGSGLRNSVFMTVHPKTGEVWATDMGRDLLGDNLPPDEVNVVIADSDYGWPVCYGRNVHDRSFDKNPYQNGQTGVCDWLKKTPARIDLPAHVAPLGLAFVPDSWPERYRGQLVVAYHGSWNSSVPVGYKLAIHRFDVAGSYLGGEDFISGWLPKGAKITTQVTGRPVDVIFDKGGVLYISDDKAGVVYRVTPPTN